MLGRDESDPLFLQVKEAEASVLEPFLGKSAFSHHGQRVVEGQQLTQAASDIMLGWVRVTGFDGVDRDFYVRQLWDSKGSAVVETMTPKSMTMYAQVCGAALAKCHARSGDAIAIASYLGRSDALDRALAAFAETYADQNERDYAAFQAAVDPAASRPSWASDRAQAGDRRPPRACNCVGRVDREGAPMSATRVRDPVTETQSTFCVGTSGHENGAAFTSPASFASTSAPACASSSDATRDHAETAPGTAFSDSPGR